MSDTRRSFLHSAALAAGVAQAAAQTAPQAGGGGRAGAPTGQAPAQGPGGRGGAGAPGGAPGGRGGAAQVMTPPTAVSEVQVPKMKFGNVEMSRLIVGYNPFHGMSHYTSTLNTLMGNYYTQERVVETLHRCTRFGINTCAVTPSGRSVYDHETFQLEGGKMHIIFQGPGDPNHPSYKALKPAAIYHHGENTDRFFQTGQMDQAREWCKKTRDTGVMVGVGSHKPEAIAMVQEQNWDVDFFVCCVYNRTRSQDERRTLLGGENPLGELYLEDDPPRMYKVIRQTSKPCFAFKILAAGRVTNVEAAFKLAFDSIKPIDGVIVGVHNQLKDQVREDATIVHRLLTKA
jgi:hypothetical protein